MLPIRAAGLALALSLGACASASAPVLFVDDVAVSDVRVSTTLGSDAAGHNRITLVLVDPGPPGVSDAGASYQFEIDLGFETQQGDVLEVDGVATLRDPGGTGSFTRTFAPNAGHDPNVLGVSATIGCFCANASGELVQTVRGTIEVTHLFVTETTLNVDLVVEGSVPNGGATRRLRVMGAFTGTRPGR